MKRYEFYIKYKSNSLSPSNSIFHRINWWHIVLPIFGAVLIGPLAIYARQRSVPSSLGHYLRMVEYCFLIVVPFILFLLWLNWRESIKRNRGYGWIGKFKITNKQSSFAFYYLHLSPGNSKLKVARSLFDKTRVGYSILIRRDALGNIEEIRKVSNRSSRLTKIGIKRLLKTSRKIFPTRGLERQQPL